MTEYDKQKFPSDMRQVVWSDFLYTYALGVRTYLVKADGDASTPAERRKLAFLKTAHYTVIGVFYLLVLWLVYLCWPFVLSKCLRFFDILDEDNSVRE